MSNRAWPWVVALALAALAAPWGAGLAQGAPAGGEAGLIREEIERFYRAGSFEGAALVARGDQVLAAEGVGFSDRRSGVMNTPDTVFAAGSISKQFTAAAVLKLAEEGKLSLADPLSRFLPEYPVEHLTRGGVAVTLDHLLHHTAALPDPDLTVDLLRARWHRPTPLAERVAAAAKRPLVGTPGERLRYSNFGYDLLGEVVRRAGGQGLDGYLRSRLLEPLGMFHTSFAPAAADEGRLARGSYLVLGRRLDAAGTFGLTAPPLGEAHASGGLRTTVGDLHRWTKIFRGEGPLGRASIDAMVRPGLKKYGCGVVNHDADGWPAYWHDGALAPLGFTGELSYFPGEQATVAILANVDVQEGHAAARLRSNLAKILQKKPTTRAAANPTLSGAMAAMSAGVYYVVLGPWRRLFLALLLAYQAVRLLLRPASRLGAAHHVIDGWSVSVAVLVLADLSLVPRWAGLGLISACAARCYQASLGLPWAHRPRLHHGVYLLMASTVLGLVAWLLGGRLLPPLALLLGLLLFARYRARPRATP